MFEWTMASPGELDDINEDVHYGNRQQRNIRSTCETTVSLVIYN